MTRYFCFFFLLFISLLVAEPLRVDVKAPCAVMINADTGVVLYEKNSREQKHPASTTKIATIIYMLERGNADLNATVQVEAEALAMTSEQAKKKAQYKLPPHYLEPDGTTMGLQLGERLKLLDLIYGSLFLSGNDASNVIAQHVSGTIPKFVQGLNEYLIEQGCTDTHFANPHGLTHPDHYTTAWDLALITKHALKHPLFRQICSSVKYTAAKNNKKDQRTLLNTNKLLRKGPHYYSKAIGVKSGYTGAAQNTLVAGAEHEGRTLIAVLMHCKERVDIWQDSTKLFQAAFAQPLVERVLLPAGLQPYQRTVKGAGRTLKTVLSEPLVWRFYPAEEEPVQATLVWADVQLPIAKGQQVAEVRVTAPGGRLVASAPLLAAHEVNASIPLVVWNWVQLHPWLTTSIAVLVIGLLFVLRRR